MNLIVDTNVLVRAVVRDDPTQAAIADRTLREATRISVALGALCELVWVLQRVYKFPRPKLALTLRALLAAKTVSMNRPAVEAGLLVLEAGGDFADGVIAWEGRWLGGEVFVSFDRRAVRLLQEQGQKAELLAGEE